jgi:hypothetical protein
MVTPYTLAFEVGTGGSYQGDPNALLQPHVGLCYSTSPDGTTTPETTGGIIYFSGSQPGSNPYTFQAGSSSDPNAAITANAFVFTQPSYTVNAGGTNGGQVLTLNLPVAVCPGPCDSPGTAPYTTGAIVGTLQQESASGISAAYQLSSLCLYVDGTQVPTPECNNATFLGGVTTTGSSPVDTTPLGGCGALVCGPGYIGLSGAQLATVYIPGTPIAVPVYGEGKCIYRAQSGPPPSPDPCTQ